MAAGGTVTTILAGCQSTSESSDSGLTRTTTSTTLKNTTTSGNGTTPTSTRSPDDDLPTDTNQDDGYPPTFEKKPKARQFDADSFPTVRKQPSGDSTVQVPLIPLEVAYNVYARGEARIIDTRSKLGYQTSHILGAVRSPAPKGGKNDPTGDWPKTDQIITYCHCPTHFAVQRAAYLLDNGFEEVYALQGGYQAWKVANLPTNGRGVPSKVKTWTVKGKTASTDSGSVAYVSHNATDQVAGTKIASDGSYSIEFSFASVSGSDTVTVGTPSYEIEGSLKSFTGMNVTVDGRTGNGTTANGTVITSTTTNGTTGNSSDNSSTLNRLVSGWF